MKRRTALAAIASNILLAISSPAQQQSGPLVTVFKTPTCSCCGKWVEHLKANGFTFKVQTPELTRGNTAFREVWCRVTRQS